MKISKNTIDLLKHYNTINPGIIIEKDSQRIYSSSIDQTIISTALVPETFPVDFCVSDLNQFLNTVSLISEAEFEFKEKFVEISSENKNLKYYYGVPELVKQLNKLPKEQIVYETEISVSSGILKELFKASSTLNIDAVAFESDGKRIHGVVKNPAISSSNNFSVILEHSGNLEKFSFGFKKKNLKLIQDFSYKVKLSKLGIAEFSAENSPFSELRFWVPIEAQD
jgi:hypothetical protein